MTLKTTILIPHYKTPELLKLCLRLIRKYTDLSSAKVIVIDNHSEDESLIYLRKLKWIHLIERKPEPNETPALAHAKALDLALAQTTTPYVLSIHTDTLVKNARWLDFLIKQLEKSNQIGGVGSWKLESKPWFSRIIKQIEKSIQSLYYRFYPTKRHHIAGVGENFYYLRSHCALYRMDVIRNFDLTFSATINGEVVAGKAMHKKFMEHGYKMIFLPSKVLLNYLDHINHATMVLNPNLGAKTTSIKQGLKRIEKQLAQFDAKAILRNEQLDQ
jgi:glycosyltransferase involved in cell wall biosynthesis